MRHPISTLMVCSLGLGAWGYGLWHLEPITAVGGFLIACAPLVWEGFRRRATPETMTSNPYGRRSPEDATRGGERCLCK